LLVEKACVIGISLSELRTLYALNAASEYLIPSFAFGVLVNGKTKAAGILAVRECPTTTSIIG